MNKVRLGIFLAIFVVFGSMVWIGEAQADATIMVTTISDTIAVDGLCSLREAIIAANTDSAFNGCPAGSGGDTITFSAALPPPATFLLTKTGSNEDNSLTGDLDLGGTLTIIGSGASNTILDGNGSDRVLEVLPGAHVTISGLTVQHGNPGVAVDGGGIKVSGSLTLSNSTVTANQGDGIYNIGGLLVLTEVNVTNNTGGYGIRNLNLASLTYTGGLVSGNQGGGVYNATSSASLSNLIISGNTVGGGVFNSGATLTHLTLHQCEVSNNTRTNGGGIFNEGTGAILDIFDTRITGNHATAAGGGVFNNGIMTISQSTLDQNQARSGGGIDHFGGNLHLINDTLSGNTVNDNGGGLYNRGNAVLTNITLSGNTAGGASTGGNIFNDTAQLTIGNTIVANSEIDGNCFNSEGFIHSAGHNLDSGNTCGFNALGDLVNTQPQLGPLENNGGPTPTHALLEISPAIDMGDDVLCPDFDQRGVSRPQGAACDMGAYEFIPDSVADLAILKTATPNPVPAGGILTYTLIASNLGPDPAISVTVSDTLPVGVIFQSAVGAGWNCAHTTPTVTCNRTDLAVGPAEDITVIVTAPLSGGMITNDAGIQTVSLDPVSTNNTTSVTISVLPSSDYVIFLPAIFK